MYVLNVIPLARSAPPGSLSYRSSTKLPLGSFVSVSLRKQTVPGIVVGVSSVAEAKAQLKTASFALSKSAVATTSRMPTALFEAAERLAAYHAAPIGSVIATLLAEVLPETFPKLSSGAGFRTYRVEGSFAKRCAGYRSRIESTLASKKAALLIVPTIAELDLFKREFADLSPLVLSGSLPAKQRTNALIVAPGHKGLILATPAFAWTPIAALGAVVVERMSAGTYVLPKRPYLDMRKAAEELARAREIPFVMGDYPLPLENRSTPEAPFATEPTTPRHLLDTRGDKERQKEWQTIPQEMQHHISAVLAKEGRVVLLAVRKGYSPTVVCRDCGTAVTDSRGRILSFAKVKGKSVFRSSDGVEVLSTDTTCAHCGSWNLYPLGVGVERVYEEAKRLYPKAHVVHFDATTPAQARKLLKEIREPNTIVVGTEFMVPWLPPTQSFELAGIVSADTLLSLPFWRARERFVRVSLMLAERAQVLLLATRKPEDTAIEAVLSPTTTTFFTEETNLRKILQYPPFGTLVHFSAEATKEKLDEAVTLLRERIKGDISVLPYQQSKGMHMRMSAVLQVPSAQWPSEELAVHIRSLPPWIRVRIDTESLW